MNALIAGEIDFFEVPPVDLLPIMESNPEIIIKPLPLGIQGWMRLNHLHPPFNNPAARQAMLWLVDQKKLSSSSNWQSRIFPDMPCLFWMRHPAGNCHRLRTIDGP